MRRRWIERRALPLLALLGTALLTGCRGETYRLTLNMASSNEAKVTVLGNRPNIRVENKGPGNLLVQYAIPPDEYEVELEAEAHMSVRSNDMDELRFETGETGTEVRITATHATGIAVDQLPMPK